jgi:hypothetical protein
MRRCIISGRLSRPVVERAVREYKTRLGTLTEAYSKSSHSHPAFSATPVRSFFSFSRTCLPFPALRKPRFIADELITRAEVNGYKKGSK